MSSILEKPARDLSAEDYESIRKPLGSRVPYPMVGLGYVVGRNGEKKLTRYLGTLSQPMMVTSERSLDAIEGNLIRDMPTPEMLPMFYEVMSAIDPKNARRAMLLIGAPGAGKTFLGELAGRISHEKGAIKVDCTGMNLSELFFETVLDFNANQRFYDALNKKIEKYNMAENDNQREQALNPMSVDILRDCLGTAFSEQSDGKICIDWSGVKDAHTTAEGEKLETRESIEIAIAGLQKISGKEGLDSLGGNALGMATQKGLAWQAYKEGRVLILDEMNRAKRGTFGIIHGWMQFVIGEIPECRVRNPLKEKGDQAETEIVFRREEMGAGHFVFGTSNTLEDSDEVLELPEALSSRVVPQHVPKATVQGWQHRLCQILTGIPISTLYNANSDVWDKDPAEFGRLLREWRVLEEDREVPDYQMAMLRRWKDIMQATEHLAAFLDSAGKTVDPDSDWHKAGTLSQLLDDISESFKKEVSVDFRKISYFLNKAFQSKPSVRVPQGDNGPTIVPLIEEMDVPESQDDIKFKLGTHMTYVIMDWIVSVSFERGKEDLGNQLMRLAADCALIDPQLVEGMASGRKTVAELLDENPFDSDDPDVRLELVRNLLCDYLRGAYDGIGANNDEIMPLSIVSRAIEEVASYEAGPVVFNDDLDTANASPLQKIESVDMTPQASDNDTVCRLKPEADRLLSQYALLVTLASSELRDRNLGSLWNDALSGSGVVASDEEGLVDESLAIAENSSESGISATTVIVSNDNEQGKEQSLHIVWNKNTDRVLVVGAGEISDKLKRAFNDARVAYVDRNSVDAEKVMRSSMGFVLGAEDSATCDSVKNAFLMRNKFAASAEETGEPGLEEILLSEELECYLPNYLAKPAPAVA